MKNNEQYQKKIAVLSGSGVGVIYTRTREPFRAIEALQEFAFSKDLPFSLWNVRDGWSTRMPTDDPDAKPKVEASYEPFAAMKWIMGVGGGQPKERGIFVMHAIHPWLNKQQHPGIIECLKHYVRDMSEMKHVRLFLIVPETEKLPDELAHDIPIQDFDLPNEEERREILEYVIESSTPASEEVPEMFTPEETEQLISASGGMTQMECEVSYAKAIVENKPEKGKGDWHDIPFEAFSRTVLNQKTEVVKSSDVLELMKPVNMDEVGGLDVAKEWATVSKTAFTEEAREKGVDCPKGITVIGPPGTGKTLFGKAISTVFGFPLIRFDISRVYGSLVGQSEANARAAVNQIKAMAPCVVLVDEVDKGLGGAHNSQGDSGVSKRVLQILLTEMQEAEEQIFWMFTANRHEAMDPAMIRKGRMDEVFAVLPPNREERAAVFKIHLEKRKQKVPKDIDVAIAASQGYVSAELEAGVKEAVKFAFYNNTKVTGALIAEMLGNMKPISQAFAEDFASMTEWAENNAKLASTPLEEEPATDSNVKPVRSRRKRAVAS